MCEREQTEQETKHTDCDEEDLGIDAILSASLTATPGGEGMCVYFCKLFRLRTVLHDFIKVGCKLVRHAGQQLLNFGNSCFNFLIIKEVYAKC